MAICLKSLALICRNISRFVVCLDEKKLIYIFSSYIYFQFYALLVSLLANVTEAIFIQPYTAHIKKAVDRAEKDHNLTEISTKKSNPTWVKKNAEFMRWHGLSMGLSMIGFLGNSVYMYHLAKSLKDL